MSLAALGLFPMISSEPGEMSGQSGRGLDRGFTVLAKRYKCIENTQSGESVS